MSDSADIFNKIPELGYEEDLKEVSSENFDHIIQNRRSVRVYTDEKIPSEITEKVLEWALLAPNSSNLQCWEFYWVKDPTKKAELIKALFNQPAARTAQELIVAVAKLKTWKKNRSQMLELFNSSSQKIPTSARAYYESSFQLFITRGHLVSSGPLKDYLS